MDSYKQSESIFIVCISTDPQEQPDVGEQNSREL